MYYAKINSAGEVKSVIDTKPHKNVTTGLIESTKEVYDNPTKFKYNSGSKEWDPHTDTGSTVEKQPTIKELLDKINEVSTKIDKITETKKGVE